MKKEEIISKIKELAYDNVNKKIEKEKKETENKINRELEDVEKILKYINNKLVYKKINEYSNKYILVNEQIFFEDYNKEMDSWDKGILIVENRQSSYAPIFKVNGERYYDIRNIIGDYEKDYEIYRRKLNDLSDSFREIELKVEELKRQESSIKDLITQYQTINIEDSKGDN